MNYNLIIIPLLLSISLFSSSCRKPKGCTDVTALNYDVNAEKDDGTCEYAVIPAPTPYTLEAPYTIDQYLPAPSIPNDNPLTNEGIALGRELFYEEKLSANNTISCASCHKQENAFTDDATFSVGIDGIAGNRNSMPLMNMAWDYGYQFFWDGRSIGLEGQAFEPVTNPIEMHNTWGSAVSELQADSKYPELFERAFGTNVIDSNLVVKALAQFERTLISGNSKFDKYLKGDLTLTPSELSGYNIFMDESGGDCFHCHGDPYNPLWTDNLYHNNGLDASFTDLGRGAVTGNSSDNGKFKTPSLRNLIYTAPYMHDGRFQTLDEVINHYSIGLQYSSTIDPLMKNVSTGGVQLNPQDREDLKAFLLTLTDEQFVTDPRFSDPD
jgi:cytochrome c peroxidase